MLMLEYKDCDDNSKI